MLCLLVCFLVFLTTRSRRKNEKTAPYPENIRFRDIHKTSVHKTIHKARPEALFALKSADRKILRGLGGTFVNVPPKNQYTLRHCSLIQAIRENRFPGISGCTGVAYMVWLCFEGGADWAVSGRTDTRIAALS